MTTEQNSTERLREEILADAKRKAEEIISSARQEAEGIFLMPRPNQRGLDRRLSTRQRQKPIEEVSWSLHRSLWRQGAYAGSV